MDLEGMLLEQFKKSLEQGDTAGAFRFYKAMSPFGLADLGAQQYIHDRKEVLSARLEEFYKTQGGQEIKKMQDEEQTLLDLQGKMIHEARSKGL
jgi:hypothetical protein